MEAQLFSNQLNNVEELKGGEADSRGQQLPNFLLYTLNKLLGFQQEK